LFLDNQNRQEHPRQDDMTQGVFALISMFQI
jgi:hypothetical protein